VSVIDESAPRPPAVGKWPDFQLSLAIGKEGQKRQGWRPGLTGWRIDIRSDAVPADKPEPNPDAAHGAGFATASSTRYQHGRLKFRRAPLTVRLSCDPARDFGLRRIDDQMDRFRTCVGCRKARGWPFELLRVVAVDGREMVIAP